MAAPFSSEILRILYESQKFPNYCEEHISILQHCSRLPHARHARPRLLRHCEIMSLPCAPAQEKRALVPQSSKNLESRVAARETRSSLACLLQISAQCHRLKQHEKSTYQEPVPTCNRHSQTIRVTAAAHTGLPCCNVAMIRHFDAKVRFTCCNGQPAITCR